MIKLLLQTASDIFHNIFLSRKYDLVYVVENSDWSIKWDGKYITKNLTKNNLLKGKISTTHIGLRGKIIHFGSANTLINSKGIKKVHPSNKIILTWFHIEPNDSKKKFIPLLNDRVNLIHTSCEITKKLLIENGLNRKKIIVIPLGIDLNIFKPFSKEKIIKLKEKHQIPLNKIIIGSFQKDGAGWKEGLEPKLVKGPDIFCEVIKKISKKYPIHIILTGPSRGYVKKRLEDMNVPYTHIFLKQYTNIVDFYNMIDLYIITSRAEGGPKALLESMACKIPLVSTRVGMIDDMVKNNKNLIVCETEDIDCLIRKSLLLLKNNEIKNNSIEQSLEYAQEYSWDKIAIKYYNQLYK